MAIDLLTKKNIKAVLAGLQHAGVSDFEHESSMNELERLVKTLGFVTLARVSQKRKTPAPSSVFGKGKLKELAKWTGGSGVVHGFRKNPEIDDSETEDEDILEEDSTTNPENELAEIVIVDRELSPKQLSNLEQATGVEVLDRTGVILEIFSRHAQSREARLQVEIAKLAYLAPRLRASHLGSDRQGGGIGAKGAGESAYELDSRRIRDRIAELRVQLKAIRTEQITRRSQRKEVPSVALIGYTNAGKSSLMRQLTTTNIEGEDKLFATLDTTVRILQPETTPKILISDTVGFIKKLPHDLVASFRSTLDEAQAASLQLFVIDGSDPNFRSQLEVAREVIKEIGAQDRPHRLVINKIDLVDDSDLVQIRSEFPEAIFISARDPGDIEKVREEILSFFEQDMSDAEVHVPFTEGHLLAKIRARARILQESHDESGTLLKIRANKVVIAWIQNLF